MDYNKWEKRRQDALKQETRQEKMTANFGRVMLQNGADLALRLFTTDPRVQEFARTKSEGSPDRLQAVIQKMWERDEFGWKSECEAIARRCGDGE